MQQALLAQEVPGRIAIDFMTIAFLIRTRAIRRESSSFSTPVDRHWRGSCYAFGMSKPLHPFNLPPVSAPPERRSRRSSGGIKLSDVARLAGVSPITASRALNTPDLVSPATLQRVREAVQETGYVPNMVAGGLASSRSRLVAAIVPTLIGPVFLETIQSLTEALAAAGYQVMLGQSGYADSREDALLNAVMGRRPDGIVLTGILHSDALKRRLAASGIPVVETWDLTPSPIDMLVGFSHEKIGAEVAAYLHRRGRRRVAVLSADDSRAERRNQAFVCAAVELGMWAEHGGRVPTHRVPAPTTIGAGRAGLSALLAQYPDVDAVFCSSDSLALGVMMEAQIRGLCIPEQLAVIGLGDLEFAKDLEPPLTTVRIDGTAIGRLAAQLIVDRASGKPIHKTIHDVGFSIIERESA
jgi:LacI family gluconate utilization system Gnt-I transcriptional repressor